MKMDLSKRSWKPAYTPDGKLYTGYDGSFGFETVDEPHKVHHLYLRVVSYSRGRSAADIVFEDDQGFRYDMKISGAVELMKKLQTLSIPTAVIGGIWYMAVDVVQVKKGSNYAIEVVWEGE